VDTTAPLAPGMALVTDSGTSGSDKLTNVAGVNVTGLEAAATWEYRVDTGAWLAGTGSSFNLTAGTHSYSVRQTDAAGNLGKASTAVSYALDTTPPTVSSVALFSGTGAVNGILNVGSVVSVKMTFSKTVTVTGTPLLALTIGGSTANATYATPFRRGRSTPTESVWAATH
jgi:Bacterial Ig-like domain